MVVATFGVGEGRYGELTSFDWYKVSAIQNE